MSKNGIMTSPNLEATQNLTGRLQDLHKQRQALRRQIKGNAFPATPPGRSEEREAAYQAVLKARAALRVGSGSERHLEAAEATLAELDAPRREARDQASEELQIISHEMELLKQQRAEARAALEAEAAEELRPQVVKWLEALSDFLKANEALAAKCEALTAGNITPPITPAQDVILQTTDGSKSRLNWLLAREGWSAHYAKEIQASKNLTNEHILQADRVAAAERQQRFEELQAAARISRDATSNPQAARRPSLFRRNDRARQ